MDLNPLFKSVLEQDTAAVVLCAPDHTIVYMNPAAQRSYAKRGGRALVGRSLLDCHSPASGEKIRRVVDWFAQSPEHDLVFTYHNPKQNKDVYMVALRDDAGRLIGYYEKHEYRTPETRAPYELT
ncbi:MAG: PAS domain-containing protein [Faecalibacterium sp.]